jgi:hypothetical protein
LELTDAGLTQIMAENPSPYVKPLERDRSKNNAFAGEGAARVYQSRYAAAWKGIVLCAGLRGDNAPDQFICTCLLLWDARGFPMKRKVIRSLHEYWLVPSRTPATVDTGEINPDWLA